MELDLISPTLFSVSMYVYLCSFLLYLIFSATRKSSIGIWATSLILAGSLIHTVGLIYRWVETHKTGYGYVPLSNMYESLIFFSWTIVLIYLLLEFRFKQRIIGTFATLFAFMAIAASSILPGSDVTIRPLMPALQSNWLSIHVITCFFGYAAFAVSFGISLLFLIQHRWEGISGGVEWLPKTKTLDEINYRSIVIGFPMLTVGIITGAAWAHYAWGSYWSWDPKETWSLITWLIYAAFLHARITRDWRGRRMAILSLVGFMAVLFTYFGVSYILAGLHSYASPS
ncbi:MAG: c-type cytochrome biogenesis protein CcsB [Proteobacteria bacterium]|nr:c-type cytochrome biogenesis protein CcsB [Pseudomonadota bacterium]